MDGDWMVEIGGISISGRELFIDGTVFGSIATALAMIYFVVPQDVQLLLALNHQNPQVWDFWTTSLVHQHSSDHSHLLGNLSGFTTTAVLSWILYVSIGSRGRYWKAAIAMLLPGTVLANVVSYVFYTLHPTFSLRYDRGFSGVVGEFAGFLIASLLSFWLVLGVAVWYNRGQFPFRKWAIHNWALVMYALLGSAAGALIFGGLILVDLRANGSTFVNLISHGTGMSLGLIIGWYFADFERMLPKDVEVP